MINRFRNSLVIAFAAIILIAGSSFAAEPFRILISNDDGIDSEGILALARALEPIASITVSAPQENFSGAGHSITTEGPITVKEVKRDGKFFGYGVRATPASCVKAALAQLMDKKPDLVVSGINDGGNLGRTIFVSGTFNAAQEGALQGIPAISFSLERSKSMDYSIAADFARTLVESLMKQGFPQDVVLNVNVPGCKREEIKGVALTRLSTFTFRENWVRRKTPWGMTYFWQSVTKPVNVPAEGTDHRAILDNYISISPVPIEFDQRNAIRELSKLNLSFDGKKMTQP
ncbi:MAG: 5'/3'-nucleotidase SurE [Candidatus Riflebacteria bacterium]|nr:5'/3'-nucleotidase SurE [Candidatus Riflebacteria bacterium]